MEAAEWCKVRHGDGKGGSERRWEQEEDGRDDGKKRAGRTRQGGGEIIYSSTFMWEADSL